MNVLLPETIDMLWGHLQDHPDALLMSGGTDLLPRLRAEQTAPVNPLICLERLGECTGIHYDETAVRIGALTTLKEILADDTIRTTLPVLHKATETVGSPLIRNMATLGGNICTASPAGDTLPALYVLGAEIELVSHAGTRTLPIAEFITGPGKTALAPGEILSAVTIPRTRSWSVQHFEKVGQRNALAISVVSMAGLLRLDGDVIEEARFAWGSVGPTVVESVRVEELLVGKRLSPETLEQAAAIIRGEVRPISDVRASARYRARVAGNLLLRLVDQEWDSH